MPKIFVLLWLSLFAGFLVWSAIDPKDYITWALEAAPAIIALVILALTYRRFRLTSLSYGLILVHSIILFIGAHYTYAEVPIFTWLQDHFDLARNNYDKVGHFAQGFIPAIIAREILLRRHVIEKGGWLFFIVCCIVLAIAACYELIEWWVALLSGDAADAFLGSQGYVWDTQSDMFFALCGGALSQWLLGKQHDKELRGWLAKN